MNKEQHKFAISLLRTLKKHRSAAPFMKPVDPVALAIPDYFRVITQPTDITTIEGKVNATGKAIGAATKSGRTFGIDYTGSGNWEGQSPNVYRTATEFREEVERVWGNCFKYNGPKEKNVISAMAAALEETCERMWRNMPPASIKVGLVVALGICLGPEADRALTPLLATTGRSAAFSRARGEERTSSKL